MTERLTLTASLALAPASNAAPLSSTVVSSLAKSLAAAAHISTTYTLASDAVQAVSLTPLPHANLLVLSVRSGGSKVRARITTADGATQSVPFDDALILLCRAVPVTALDLLRTTGIESVVDVILAHTA